MADVVTLDGNRRPEHDEPVEAVIWALEKLLEKARTGELQSFVACGFTSDRGRVSSYAGTPSSYYAQIGSIEELKREFIQRQNVDGLA